jgi:hypothetical protein
MLGLLFLLITWWLLLRLVRRHEAAETSERERRARQLSAFLGFLEKVRNSYK